MGASCQVFHSDTADLVVHTEISLNHVIQAFGIRVGIVFQNS